MAVLSGMVYGHGVSNCICIYICSAEERSGEQGEYE